MDIWVGYLNMWHETFLYMFPGVDMDKDMDMDMDTDMEIESPGYISGCK